MKKVFVLSKKDLTKGLLVNSNDVEMPLSVVDDPQTPFEKRWYDEHRENICQPPSQSGTMVIFFNDCLNVDKITVIEVLRSVGYTPIQDLSDVLGNDIILYEII